MSKNNEQEERYVITPKGIAMLALSNAGIDYNDPQFDTFWILFEHYMRKNGYLAEDKE